MRRLLAIVSIILQVIEGLMVGGLFATSLRLVQVQASVQVWYWHDALNYDKRHCDYLLEVIRTFKRTR